MQVEDVRSSRIDHVLDEISAYLLFDNQNVERLTLDDFYDQMADFTVACASDVAGKSYRVEEALKELVTMLFQRAATMLKECVDVTATTDGLFGAYLLAICRPSGCTVASGIVVVVVGFCNCSQMRDSKCTCLIFGVSIGLDPG